MFLKCLELNKSSLLEIVNSMFVCVRLKVVWVTMGVFCSIGFCLEGIDVSDCKIMVKSSLRVI